MFITRASPQLLGTRRIDPDYYAPVHVADEKRLRHFGSFELGDCGRFFVGPFGSELPSSLYRPSGVPLLRVGNIGQLDMSEDNLVFLDEATHKQLEASETLPGDLLIVKASVGEKICRFPTRYARGNITQHIIGIRPNGYADMDYVAVALFSPIGRRQLERRSLGSIIQYLGVVDARTVLVPRIAPDAQRYIGDKVRQAERLRERGRLASRAACELVDGLIEQRVSSAELVAAQENGESIALVAHRISRERSRGSAVERLDSLRRFSRVTFVTMTPDRMDASYYAPRFLENERLLTSCGTPMVPIASLTEKCNCGSTPVDVAYDGCGVGLIRTTDVRPNAFLGHHVLRTSELRLDPDSTVAAVTDDLLYTMSGTIGYAAVVPPTDEVFSFSNTIVRARFTKGSGQDPWFTAAFFNGKYGYTQSLRLVSGAIQGHVMPNPFKKLLVPTPDSRAQRFLGLHLRFADECANYARGLVSAAKLLVEQLIDGRIAEADLVAAQKALEAGDPNADREFLRSLRQSDASNAKPLIADVDALYAFLDGSEGQEA